MPLSITIYAGDSEYHADLPTELSEQLGPVDPPAHHDLVWEAGADNTSPINDSGSNPPVSPNRAPPAAPFPAKTPPSSSMPPGGAPQGGDDKPLKPDPQDTDGPGTNDDSYTGYVGGAPRLDPQPLPNPEGGALAPNPDNETSIPVGGGDSLDQGAKPDIDSQPWFMGSELPTFKASTSRLSLAEWPLRFAQIERDFHRPNKVYDRNAEPNDSGNEDATKLGDTDKPYQTGTPPI